MPATKEDRITITSSNDLATHFHTIQAGLSEPETEHSWQRLDRSLFQLEAITKGGAYKWTDDYVSFLRSIATPISRSLLSERTRLSGTAADVLCSAAPRLAEKFEPLVQFFLPPLLQLCARTNKVAQKRAEKCLQLVVKHCRLVNTLPFLCEACKDKFAGLRVVALGCILTLLESAGSGKLDRKVPDIEATIKLTARDPNPEVRQCARRLFESYVTAWPARVEAFTTPFTPTTRRYLSLPKTGSLQVSQPVFAPPSPGPVATPQRAAPPPSPLVTPQAQPLPDTPTTKRTKFLEQLAAAKARSKANAAVSTQFQSTGALRALQRNGGEVKSTVLSRSVPPSAEAGPSREAVREHTSALSASVRGGSERSNALSTSTRGGNDSTALSTRTRTPSPPTSHPTSPADQPTPLPQTAPVTPAPPTRGEDHTTAPSEVLARRLGLSEEAQHKPHPERHFASRSVSATKTPGPKASRVFVVPTPTERTPAARVVSTERGGVAPKARNVSAGRSVENATARPGPSKAVVAGSAANKAATVTSKTAAGGATSKSTSASGSTTSKSSASTGKSSTATFKPSTSASGTKGPPSLPATKSSATTKPAAANTYINNKSSAPAKKAPIKPSSKVTSSTSASLTAKSRATATTSREAILAARQAEVAKLKAENLKRQEAAALSAAALHAAKRNKARCGRLERERREGVGREDKDSKEKDEKEGATEDEVAQSESPTVESSTQEAESGSQEVEPHVQEAQSESTGQDQEAEPKKQHTEPEDLTPSPTSSTPESHSDHCPTLPSRSASPTRFSPKRLEIPQTPKRNPLGALSSPLLQNGSSPFRVQQTCYSSPADKLMVRLRRGEEAGEGENENENVPVF